MKRVQSLGAVCAACFVIALVIAGATAGPAPAQGNRPPTDVQVVNTERSAVPVRVTQLPAVQVGNDADSPVPVQVTSLPAVQMPEPVSVSAILQVAGGGLEASRVVFTVPAGKLLTVESINFDTKSINQNQRHLVTVQTSHEGIACFQRFLASDRMSLADSEGGAEVGYHPMQGFADPGSELIVRILRGSRGADSTIRVTLTGHMTPSR